MIDKGWILSLGLWLSLCISAHAGDVTCAPQEEGTRAALYYHATFRKYVTQLSLTLEVEGRNVTVANCSSKTANCTDVYPKMSTSVANFMGKEIVGYFVIHNVSRTTPIDMETTWRCHVGFSDETLCDPLLIYAKAANPVCDPVKYENKNEILVRCKTPRVYPPADCHFRAVFKDGTEKSVLEKFKYSHETVSKHPRYYSTVCSLRIPLSSFGQTGTLSKLKVYMLPQNSGLASNEVVEIPFELTLTSSLVTTTSDISSEAHLGIGLGTGAAVVVLITLIVVGVMWYRRRSRRESRRPNNAYLYAQSENYGPEVYHVYDYAKSTY